MVKLRSSPALVTRDIYTDPIDWDPRPASRGGDGTDPTGMGTRDALPGWLVRNRWHHYLYAKVSTDHVGLGPRRDCEGHGTCIRVSTDAGKARATAVVVAAGPALALQDRASGLPAAYFELLETFRVESNPRLERRRR